VAIGSGFGNTRYPHYYGPEGRLVFVDSALEEVKRGSTMIGIKTPTSALKSSHIKPTKPLVELSEKIFTIDVHVGATGGEEHALKSFLVSYAKTYCFPT